MHKRKPFGIVQVFKKMLLRLINFFLQIRAYVHLVVVEAAVPESQLSWVLTYQLFWC